MDSKNKWNRLLRTESKGPFGTVRSLEEFHRLKAQEKLRSAIDFRLNPGTFEMRLFVDEA